MPHVLNRPVNTPEQLRNLSSASYDYEYPDGLDLKPGSELHERLKSFIDGRLRDSYNIMSNRFDSWKTIDRTLTAYIPLSEAEKKVKDADETKPVTTVVPVSYAALDTILSSLVAAFFDPPIFRYEGFGPNDTYGAILMELLINLQVLRGKMELPLHTMLRDSIAYGFGVSHPVWDREYTTVTEVVEEGSMFRKRVVREVDQLRTEGNILENLDHYYFFPDPNVSIHEVQKGEFVSWATRDNYYNLLGLESQPDSPLFNVRYLSHIDGKGWIMSEDPGGREDKSGISKQSSTYTRPVDISYMYAKLIPSELKIGSSDRPEKWLFALAGDEIIIQAKKLGWRHNRFPIVTIAPEFDGRSATPISRLETVYGLQQAVDWLFNSHMMNVRKAINDMIIYDPQLVMGADLEDPKPGKLIRLRRAAWGRGVKDCVQQLVVNDITRGNIPDAMFVGNMIEQTTGAASVLQGIARRAGERRSATETRDVKLGALGRLERAARVISVQGFYDLGLLLASQTQQMLSGPMYARIIDRWEETLRDEYGLTKRVEINPLDLQVNVDIIPRDSSTPSGDYAEVWSQLFAIIAKSPELTQQFDTVRIFKHIARMLGARNLNDFVKKGGSIKAQVTPDEEVLDQADAGNIVPLGTQV